MNKKLLFLVLSSAIFSLNTNLYSYLPSYYQENNSSIRRECKAFIRSNPFFSVFGTAVFTAGAIIGGPSLLTHIGGKFQDSSVLKNLTINALNKAKEHLNIVKNSSESFIRQNPKTSMAITALGAFAISKPENVEKIIPCFNKPRITKCA